MTEAIEILQKQRDWYKARGKTLQAHYVSKMIERLRVAARSKNVQG